jgi:hypothetical protein
MSRNTEPKKASDQEISDQDIWLAIRRLDPDAKKDTSNIAVVNYVDRPLLHRLHSLGFASSSRIVKFLIGDRNGKRRVSIGFCRC